MAKEKKAKANTIANEHGASMDKIVSLCKRRGFIFQSSEIYGGVGAVYDYGPLGVELKDVEVRSEGEALEIVVPSEMADGDPGILVIEWGNAR